MSDNNSGINKILLSLIAALVAVIGVLSYFVFFDAGETAPVSNTVVDSKGGQQEEKPKPVKKKSKADENKVIYVMGEDGEAARRNHTSIASVADEASSSKVANVASVEGEAGNRKVANSVSVNSLEKGKSMPAKKGRVLFIGNVSSGVYHYPNCIGVAKMAEYNKVQLYSKEEAESGYRLHRGCPRNF